jgi:hypothetical protein
MPLGCTHIHDPFFINLKESQCYDNCNVELQEVRYRKTDSKRQSLPIMVQNSLWEEVGNWMMQRQQHAWQYWSWEFRWQTVHWHAWCSANQCVQSTSVLNDVSCPPVHIWTVPYQLLEISDVIWRYCPTAISNSNRLAQGKSVPFLDMLNSSQYFLEHQLRPALG